MLNRTMTNEDGFALNVSCALNSERDGEEDMKEQFERLMTAFERIADVLELWADKQ